MYPNILKSTIYLNAAKAGILYEERLDKFLNGALNINSNPFGWDYVNTLLQNT